MFHEHVALWLEAYDVILTLGLVDARVALSSTIKGRVSRFPKNSPGFDVSATASWSCSVIRDSGFGIHNLYSDSTASVTGDRRLRTRSLSALLKLHQCGRIERNDRHRQSRPIYELRILSGSDHIPLRLDAFLARPAVNIAAHQNDPLEILAELRLQAKRVSHILQRTYREQHQLAGIFLGHAHDRLRGRLGRSACIR